MAPDPVKTPNDEKALALGYTYRPELGQHVCEFFRRYLRHSSGEWAGQPFELAPWQREQIIMPLFSWLRPDGRRRFRRAQIWIPKKNGKSALCSGINLYLLVGDGEDGAQVYCVANDRSQAGIVFNESANMVDASPALRSKLKVIRTRNRIVKDTASWIEALSAEVATSEGKNAHGISIDEIHAFDSRGKRLRESLRHAGAARRNALEVVISTAGDDLSDVGREEYDEAKRIHSGDIEDLSTFVFIAEADPEDDWTSPATWRKANPSLGITIREEDMAEECEKAKQSPRLQSSFKRYRLNVWVGAESPALDMHAWAQAADPGLSEDELIGLPCVGGLDLSTKIDFCAFTLVYERDDEYILWPRLWLPSANIEQRGREDGYDYRQAAEDGLISLCDGPEIDFGQIEREVFAAVERSRPPEVAYDPWNAKGVIDRLKLTLPVTWVEFPQQTKYFTDASKELEAAVKGGRIVHPDNPILTRMAASLSWMTDTNGNIRPVKNDRRKKRRRIDGIVAAIMAIARLSATRAERQHAEQDSGEVVWV